MKISKQELLNMLTSLPDPHVFRGSECVFRILHTKTVINKGIEQYWYTFTFKKIEVGDVKEWVIDLPIPSDKEEKG